MPISDKKPVMALIGPIGLAAGGLVALSLIPMLLALFSGAKGAGLIAGFAQPLERAFHIAVIFGIGALAMRMGRSVLLTLPAAYLLMLIIGALTDIALAQFTYSRAVLFGAILLYALVVGLVYSRRFLIGAGLASAFAFYCGTQYILQAPDVASLGFFIAGFVIATALVLACGVSFAVAVQGYGAGWLQRCAERLKRIPAVASFMAFF